MGHVLPDAPGCTISFQTDGAYSTPWGAHLGTSCSIESKYSSWGRGAKSGQTQDSLKPIFKPCKLDKALEVKPIWFFQHLSMPMCFPLADAPTGGDGGPQGAVCAPYSCWKVGDIGVVSRDLQMAMSDSYNLV